MINDTDWVCNSEVTVLAVFVFLMNKLWATSNGFGQTGAAGDAAVIHLSIFMFSKLTAIF